MHLPPASANHHTPSPAYHNGCVSDSVFRYDHAVAVLLPLRRLILHIGDGDGQLHRTAPVPPVCSHDFPGDIGPLWQRVHPDEEKRKGEERRSLDGVFLSCQLVWRGDNYSFHKG